MPSRKLWSESTSMSRLVTSKRLLKKQSRMPSGKEASNTRQEQPIEGGQEEERFKTFIRHEISKWKDFFCSKEHRENSIMNNSKNNHNNSNLQQNFLRYLVYPFPVSSESKSFWLWSEATRSYSWYSVSEPSLAHRMQISFPEMRREQSNQYQDLNDEQAVYLLPLINNTLSITSR